MPNFLKNTILLIVGVGIIFSLQLTSKSTFLQENSEIVDISSEEKTEKEDGKAYDFLAYFSKNNLNFVKFYSQKLSQNQHNKKYLTPSPLTSPPNV